MREIGQHLIDYLVFTNIITGTALFDYKEPERLNFLLTIFLIFVFGSMCNNSSFRVTYLLVYCIGNT